jgi:hypothetical protein
VVKKQIIMAQFIAVALKSTIVLSKKQLQADRLSDDVAIQTVKDNYDLSLYDYSETDHFYLWKLKEDVLTAEIVPFLDAVLTFYYAEEESSIKSLLGEVGRKKDHDSLMKITKLGEYEHFELDNTQYAQIHLKKQARHLRVDFNYIQLIKSERVRIDNFDKTMQFLENCMKKAFSDFQLSKALEVYIADTKYTK